MQTIVADMQSKGRATAYAERSNAEAFVGQRYVVERSTLNPKKFAVVLFDGEVMPDTAKIVTYRGGRGEDREGDVFRAGLNQRKTRKDRGGSVRGIGS